MPRLAKCIRYLAPKGINLPNGLATTSQSYYYFLDQTGIRSKEIEKFWTGLDVKNVKDLEKRGAKIRSLIMKAKLPKDFEEEIRQGYRELSQSLRSQEFGRGNPIISYSRRFTERFFCRSAGIISKYQRREERVELVKKCIASLFTDRAIVYRVENKFEHMKVALSVGIQQMVAVHARLPA